MVPCHPNRICHCHGRPMKCVALGRHLTHDLVCMEVS